jgi:hypothetical protein
MIRNVKSFKRHDKPAVSGERIESVEERFNAQSDLFNLRFF